MAPTLRRLRRVRHFPAGELPLATCERRLRAMHLTPLDPHTTPEASQPILAGIADDLGTVPNMAAVIAASPTLLTAFDALRRAVAELDPAAREVAGLAVSVAVDNRYGTAFHARVLGRLGVADADIDRMRAGDPPADERLAAVHAFARAVARERGKVGDEIVAAVTAAGY